MRYCIEWEPCICNFSISSSREINIQGLSNAQHNVFSWMDEFNSMITDPSIDAKAQLTASTIKKSAMKEIASAMKNVFRKILIRLVIESRDELRNNYDTFQRALLIVLVMYCFLQIFFYMLWIYPTANRLNTEVIFVWAKSIDQNHDKNAEHDPAECHIGDLEYQELSV